MNPTLGWLVDATAAAAFRGRQAEIDQVVSLLAGKDGLPRAVCLVGPPGIGKTALVRALERRVHDDGLGGAVVVDAHEFDHTTRGIIELLRARAPAARPDNPRPLLVAVDNCDDISLPDRRRLREDFSEHLAGPVLQLTVYRNSPLSLRGQWAGWRERMHEIRLGPLGSEDALRFLDFQGVPAGAVRDAALALAGGNPLVLSAAAHVAGLDPHMPLWRIKAEAAQLFRERLVRELDEGVLPVLEAAVLLPTVNEEILAGMLGRDLGVLFDRFTRLSVVETLSDAYSVAEPVRSVLRADLLRRRPGHCEALRRRAARLRPANPGTEPSSLPPNIVKGALEDIDSPARLARSALADLASIRAAGDQPGMVLQGVLREGVDRLRTSERRREREAGAVLHDYYVARVGSLEVIGERLGLGRATLFRRLSAGVIGVAQWLETF